MIKKFKNIPDEELAILARNGDVDAEKELLGRYHYSIRTLASKLLLQYRQVTYAEFEDLSSIGQHAIYIAIEKIGGGVPFSAYWRKVCQHMMLDYIHECENEIPSNKVIVSEKEDLSPYVIGHSDLTNFFILEDEILRIITDPRNEISCTDAQLFSKDCDGFTVQELAREYGFAYNTVKLRISKVREKIVDILFNS